MQCMKGVMFMAPTETILRDRTLKQEEFGTGSGYRGVVFF